MKIEKTLKAHVGKIATLTDAEFDYFVSHLKTQRFQKGQAIIGAGEKVETEYFVISCCFLYQ